MRQIFRNRREAPDVREHDGHTSLADVNTGRFLVSVEDSSDHSFGHETREGLHTPSQVDETYLELKDLKVPSTPSG